MGDLTPLTPEAIREWAAEIRQEPDFAGTANSLDAIAARIAELEAEVARKDAALAAAESWIVDGGYCDDRDPHVAESAGFIVDEIRTALRALTGGDDRG